MTVRWRGRHVFDTIHADDYEGLGGILQNPGQDFFVSSNRGNNNLSGLNWGNPKAEIQAGMELAAEARYKGRGLCRIYVESGGYTGPILTPTNADCPFGALIGVNNNGEGNGPWLQALTAGGTILTVRARGWLVSGFEFDLPTTGKGIILDHKTSGASASYTKLRKCLINGGRNGTFGIDFHGGATFVIIEDDVFYDIYNAGGTAQAIGSTDSSNDTPNFAKVIGCHFANNDKHLSLNSLRGFKMGIVTDNFFMGTGHLKTATVLVDMKNGGANFVARNYFGGTYSEAGGYRAAANDIWADNWQTAGVLAALPA